MQPNDIGSLFEHVASILRRQSDQIMQERLGIGISQFVILSALAHRPHTNQRVLATYLGQTEASVSRQISLLREKGMLVTRIDPAERRQRLAALTSKGAKITQAAREVQELFYQPLLGQLTQREQSQLQTLLTTLHEQTCAPGKRLACDRPGDIETLYVHQSLVDLSKS